MSTSPRLTRRAARLAARACRPALFVYELPDKYRHEGGPDGRGFGTVLASSPPGLPPASLFASHTYATGAAFFEAAMRYRCRTEAPEEADLFFVPSFNLRFGAQKVCVDAWPTNRKNCSKNALFDRLRAVRNGSGSPFLEARGGADHILLTGHQGFWFDMHASFELHYRDRRLRGAMLFSVEEGAEYPWPGAKTGKGIHSTPWSSVVHMAASTRRSKLPWRSRHERSLLVAGAFGTHRAYGPASKQFNELRGAIHRACLNHTGRCEHATPGPTTGMEAVVALYWRAVFCLQPVGDGVSRAAIIDAVLLGELTPPTSPTSPTISHDLTQRQPHIWRRSAGCATTRAVDVRAGCVPVLFHPGQYLQWPWHWGAWVRNATVMLDLRRTSRGELDPIEALAAVPAARVAAMQATIAAHGHCLHYPRADGPQPAANRSHTLSELPSALDVTLQGSWMHARGLDTAGADLCARRLHEGVGAVGQTRSGLVQSLVGGL